MPRRNQLGRRSVALDGRTMRVFLGSTGAGVPSAVSHHDLADNASGDDHPQYGNLSQAETVSAIWVFNAGISIGGAGLTVTAGGGNIIGSVTLDGDLDFTGPQEITTSSGNLSLTPAADLMINSDVVFGGATDISTTTGAITFSPASVVYIDSDLHFITAQTIYTDAGNLTLLPAGDLIIDPTGQGAYPAASYDVDLGTEQNKWLTIHAAELWVDTLVAQDVIATIGGYIIVAPTSELITQVLTTDLVIQVKHNSFLIGDTLLLEKNGQVEFMLISGGPTDVSGGYQYSVSRNQDGSGANQWEQGDAIVSTGSTGSGWLELYSQDSINGIIFDYIFVDDGGVFGSNLANSANFDLFPSAAAVNDAIYFGYITTLSSHWSNIYFYISTAGSYSGVSFAYEYWNGATWTSLIGATGPTLSTTGPKALLFTGSSQTGWAARSVNGSSNAYYVRIRISSLFTWATTPKQGGRRIHGERRHYGPSILGNVRTGSTYNDWEARFLLGRMDGEYGISNLDFGIGIGDYSSGNYLLYTETDGFAISAGGGIVSIDASGVDFNLTSGAEATIQGLTWFAGGNEIGRKTMGYSGSDVTIYNRAKGNTAGSGGATHIWYADPSNGSGGASSSYFYLAQFYGGASQFIITLSGDGKASSIFEIQDDISTSYIKVDLGSGQRAVIFNEDSWDLDFRVESDNNANAIMIDAANDRLGIMRAPTTYDFEVGGDSYLVGHVRVDGWKSSGLMPFAIYQTGGGTPGGGITAAQTVYSATWGAKGRVRSFYVSAFVDTTNDSSDHWNIRLRRVDDTGTLTVINTAQSTESLGADTWGQVGVNFTSTTWDDTEVEALFIDVYKTGSPGTLYLGGPWVWFEAIL